MKQKNRCLIADIFHCFFVNVVFWGILQGLTEAGSELYYSNKKKFDELIKKEKETLFRRGEQE